MTRHVLVLLVMLIAMTGKSTAQQKFYYAADGHKAILKEDTTKILIKFRNDEVMHGFLSAKGLSTSALDSSGVVAFKTAENPSRQVKLLEKDTNVVYVSHEITLGGMPLLPTGEVLIKLQPGANVNNMMRRVGIENTAKITRSGLPNLNLEAVKPPDGEQVMMILQVDKDSVFDVANRIYESGFVEYAHPNFFIPGYVILDNLRKRRSSSMLSSFVGLSSFMGHVITPADYPTDPLSKRIMERPAIFRNKSAFRTGYYAPQDFYMSKLGDMDSTWLWRDLVTLKQVVIMDDGLEYNGIINFVGGYTPYYPASITPGQPTQYQKYHGEAMAGILGAHKFPGTFSGMASDAPLLSVNIFTGFETLANYADAYVYCRYSGAPVMCGGFSYRAEAYLGEFSAVATAFDNARVYGCYGKGMSMICASGNNGTNDVSSPADYTGAIAVGAVTTSYGILSTANYGYDLDVVGISENTDMYTCDRAMANGENNTNYTYAFGNTSAACAEVAAMALIMRSIDTTIDELGLRLMMSGSVVDMGAAGFDPIYGQGRLDVLNCVRGAVNFKATVKPLGSVANTRDYLMDVLDPFPTGTAGYRYFWTWSNTGIATLSYPVTPRRTVRLTKVTGASGSGTLTCSFGPLSGWWITKSVTVNVSAAGVASIVQNKPVIHAPGSIFSEKQQALAADPDGVTIVASPNPVSSSVRITLRNVTAGILSEELDNSVKGYSLKRTPMIGTIELFAAGSGKRAFVQSFRNQSSSETINVSNLASGLYIVKVTSEEKVVTSKISIQH